MKSDKNNKNASGTAVRTSLLCVCALLATLGFTSCAKSGKSAVAETGGKLKVSVTFNALSEMAVAVGGEYAVVSAIIPDGTEPHDFEPKAKDMVALSEADVFVYNGLGLESWAQRAVGAAGNAKLVSVDASAGCAPITLPGGGTDPHLWLSIKGAEIETANIAKGFAAADPAHAESYAKNAASYIAELEKLYDEYSGKIASAPSKVIVTGHAAFAYFCGDFGIEQNSVEDVFASGEPNPQQLASLVDFARAKKVKTIFAEELASPSVSRTLADEVGAKVATIYTMEGSEDGKSYIDRMRANLEAVYASLIE
jgi:zinc transport system substrate-binding protein